MKVIELTPNYHLSGLEFSKAFENVHLAIREQLLNAYIDENDEGIIIVIEDEDSIFPIEQILRNNNIRFN